MTESKGSLLSPASEKLVENKMKLSYDSRGSIDAMLKGIELAVKHLRVLSYDQNKTRNAKTVNELIDAIQELGKLSSFLGQEIIYPKVVVVKPGHAGTIFPPDIDD